MTAPWCGPMRSIARGGAIEVMNLLHGAGRLGVCLVKLEREDGDG